MNIPYFKIKEFFFPENWCIKVDNNKDVALWFNENSQTGAYDYHTCVSGYLHYPAKTDNSKCKFHHFSNIQAGYSEISYEQFVKHVLNQKNTKENYKYTVDYCKKNKVAIRVRTPEEVEKCDKILDNYERHSYLYRDKAPLDATQCINATSDGNAEESWYKKDGYEIIEAADFIKFNTNTQKIIGYKCPTNLFNGEIPKGEMYLLGTDGFYYPNTHISDFRLPKEIVETWNPIFDISEYKVDDWVFITGIPRGNGLSSSGSQDGIFKLMAVDKSKHPTGHLQGQFMFCFNGHFYRTKIENILRKATEEEIKKAEEELLLIVDVYKPEFFGIKTRIVDGNLISIDQDSPVDGVPIITEDSSYVKYGCTKITLKDLYALKTVMSLAKNHEKTLVIDSNVAFYNNETNKSLSMAQIDVLIKKLEE